MIWPWDALNYFLDVILSFECSRLTDVVINDSITVFNYHSSNLANLFIIYQFIAYLTNELTNEMFNAS